VGVTRWTYPRRNRSEPTESLPSAKDDDDDEDDDDDDDDEVACAWVACVSTLRSGPCILPSPANSRKGPSPPRATPKLTPEAAPEAAPAKLEDGARVAAGPRSKGRHRVAQ